MDLNLKCPRLEESVLDAKPLQTHRKLNNNELKYCEKVKSPGLIMNMNLRWAEQRKCYS